MGGWSNGLSMWEVKRRRHKKAFFLTLSNHTTQRNRVSKIRDGRVHLKNNNELGEDGMSVDVCVYCPFCSLLSSPRNMMAIIHLSLSLSLNSMLIQFMWRDTLHSPSTLPSVTVVRACLLCISLSLRVYVFV